MSEEKERRLKKLDFASTILKGLSEAALPGELIQFGLEFLQNLNLEIPLRVVFKENKLFIIVDLKEFL